MNDLKKHHIILQLIIEGKKKLLNYKNLSIANIELPAKNMYI